MFSAIYLLAIPLGAFALYLIYLLSRRPVLGLFILLAVNLYNITFGLNSSAFGRLHLDAGDAVCICLLFAGLIRTVQNLKSVGPVRAAALCYLLILAVNVARGVAEYGVFTAGNESRSFLGPLLCLLYFMDAPTDDLSVSRYTRMYIYFGFALCIVAVLAMLGFPVGGNARIQEGVEVMDYRFLPAAGACAIAVCVFLALARYQYRERGLFNLLLPILFLSTAIYLRHRSVWVMLLAGVFALMPFDSKLFLRIVPAVIAAAVAVGGLVVYGSVHSGLAGEQDFSQSASNEDTLIWRINGWESLLFEEDQTAFTTMFGKSIGGGYERIDPDSHLLTNVAPHSEYVQEYERVGFVGIICLCLIFLAPIGKLWRLKRSNPLAVYPSVSTWAIVAIMFLAYGVTYSLDLTSYALIGIANAMFLGPGKLTARNPQKEKEGWLATVEPLSAAYQGNVDAH